MSVVAPKLHTSPLKKKNKNLNKKMNKQLELSEHSLVQFDERER